MQWGLLLPLFQQCLLDVRTEQQEEEDEPRDVGASWDTVLDFVALGLADQAAATLAAMPDTAFVFSDDRAVVLVCSSFSSSLHTNTQTQAHHSF